MKKATKILMITATLIIAVALLVACNPESQHSGYTVTFVTNGGSDVASQTTSQIAAEPVTIREDYTFAGWYDNSDFNGNRILFPYTPTGNVTLYAKWTKNDDPIPSGDFRVTFVTNGGSEVQPFTGKTIASEPSTVRATYEFAGWYDNPDFNGSRISFPITLTKNMIFYAKWDKESEWVQTTAEDYEYYRDKDTDTVIAVIYNGSAKKIILPTDTDLMTYENTYLWLGEDPTVTAIKLPSNVTEIPDPFWFSNLESVKEYAVEDSHTTMSSKDGALYSKNGQTLILYPLAKTETSFTVPSTVKTVGEACFYGNTHLESITLSEGVEAVGRWGVSYMPNLKNVSIPSTLTTLNYGVFENDVKIEEITFPENIAMSTWGSNVFKGCDGLKRLIGPGIMSVSSTAAVNLEYVEINSADSSDVVSFQNKTKLQTVKINVPVHTISFSGCSALKNITLPNEMGWLQSYAFENCVALEEIEIPSNLEDKSIGSNIFQNCTSLKRVILPEGITGYGRDCFTGSGIEELYIPTTVMPSWARSLIGAEHLKTLTCPAECVNKLFSTMIGYNECPVQNLIINSGTAITYKYTSWKSLHTLEIPASVTSIDELAFEDIPALVQLTNLSSVDWTPILYEAGTKVPNANIEIRRSKSTPFEGKITEETNGFVKYTHEGEVRVLDCDRTVTSLTASDFVGYTSIGAYAFTYSKLASVVIPSNIKSIGEEAFWHCKSLAQVTIQEGVERIDKYAFSGVNVLTEVTLPHSLTYVGMDVFSTSGMTINVKGYSSTPSGWHSGWYSKVPSVDPPITVNWNA